MTRRTHIAADVINHSPFHQGKYNMVSRLQSLRKRRSGVCALVGALALATNATATTPEERAVLAPLQAIFDGLAIRDKNLVIQQLLPGGSATLMRDGKPLQLTFAEFADRITQSGPTPREERMHDALIRIDDNIAIIWTPYVVTVAGKLDHCGTDIANLVRLEGKWLIAGLADTSRKECRAKR